jgi:hypothetical protein
MLLQEICSAFVQNPTVEITSKSMYFSLFFTPIDPLRKSAVLNARVKSIGLIHWNYPDFKEIYTVHFSNLAYMFRMYI